MGAHTPRREDELSDIERHLAGWQPASAGLNADAMLFAAGQAAARRGRSRLVAPALCILLVVQSAGLGVWGLSERAGRLALATRIRERAPAPTAPLAIAVAVAVLSEPSYTPSPEDYWHLRRRAEQDPGRWLASLQPPGARAPDPPPEAAILRAGQRARLLD
jgi:hypothetical protein